MPTELSRLQLHEFKHKKKKFKFNTNGIKSVAVVFKSNHIASKEFTTMMNFMAYANMAIQTV
jgi:hypothetical protein